MPLRKNEEEYHDISDGLTDGVVDVERMSNCMAGATLASHTGDRTSACSISRNMGLVIGGERRIH